MTRDHNSDRVACVRAAYCSYHLRTTDSIRNIIIRTLLAKGDLYEFIPYHLLEHRPLRRKRDRKTGTLAMKIFAQLRARFDRKRMIGKERHIHRLSEKDAVNATIGSGDLQNTDGRRFICNESDQWYAK